MPSVTLEPTAPGAGSLSQAFEERLLFLLLLLRQPWLRMIYVTSMPIKPSIIEYYLALLPGVIPSHAMARLSLLSVGDSSPGPVSAKLLDRPRMLSKIARFCRLSSGFLLVTTCVGRAGCSIAEGPVRSDRALDDAESADLHVQGVAVGDHAAELVLVLQCAEPTFR